MFERLIMLEHFEIKRRGEKEKLEAFRSQRLKRIPVKGNDVDIINRQIAGLEHIFNCLSGENTCMFYAIKTLFFDVCNDAAVLYQTGR